MHTGRERQASVHADIEIREACRPVRRGQADIRTQTVAAGKLQQAGSRGCKTG
jgi:hypothetical protein